MPIYEYQSIVSKTACKTCRDGFEIYQKIEEEELSLCPKCGKKITKIISYCHAAIVESSEEHTRTMAKIKSHESSGEWSHAAEIADKHSEKIQDNKLKSRALDNYKKAGYDVDSLSKHVEVKKKKA